MKLHCILIDYGVGNIHSLRKAIERTGARVTPAQTPEEVLQGDAILLPGVGAFGPAAQQLAPLKDAILERLEAGTPLLGVCLGMQLLYDASEEAPGASGLGWIPGTIQRLQHPKLPQIGWNTLHAHQDDPLLADADGCHVYYVNSYGAPVTQHTTATTQYGNQTLTAIARRHNAWGTQFHPEKSSHTGLAMLQRWVKLAEEIA